MLAKRARYWPKTMPEINDATIVKTMPGRICRKLRRPQGSQACRTNNATVIAVIVMP